MNDPLAVQLLLGSLGVAVTVFVIELAISTLFTASGASADDSEPDR